MAGCGILLTCALPQSQRASLLMARLAVVSYIPLVLASILKQPIYAMKEVENFKLDG
jgi:hypothetical protein